MAPFRRGESRLYYIYVPLPGGRKLRSTGSTSKQVAKSMEGMVEGLRNSRQLDLLEAVASSSISLGELYDHFSGESLDALRSRLSGKMLVDYIDRWVTTQKMVAPAAWRDQERQVRRLVANVETPDQLTPGAVCDALAQLHVQGGTARHYLYALSSFCNYLVAHGVLPANPCELKSLVKRPRKANKRKLWRTEDVDRTIIAQASGDLRIALVLCAASGADRSTPLIMQVRHLHLLPEGESPNKGRGKEHRVDLPGSKTEGRDRKGVRLEPWAVPILREWVRDKRPHAPLVQGVSADMMTRHWRTFADAVGEQQYWLRDLRHSYAVRAILADYQLWEVSAWLGHSSMAVTADIYTKFEYEVARRVRGDMVESGST